MSNLCLDCGFDFIKCEVCGELRAPEDVDENNVCHWCNTKLAKQKYGNEEQQDD